MIALKKFLIELCQKVDFKDDRKLEIQLYTALYHYATDEGKYLGTLFHDVGSELQFDPWSNFDRNKRPFYQNVSPKSYSHPANQVCGRVLESREKVYRCADCGYDDTCVICSFCFKKEDHEGHNISVYVSQANGGMCDCGDETAFVRKLNCACPSRNERLSADFNTSIRATLKTILDYILDVTNLSISTLPFIHKNIDGRGILNTTSRDISEFASLPSEVYGVEDSNTEGRWLLVLWNDENHDYPEAEAGIIAATGVDHRRAKEIANEINLKGRAVLKEALDYRDLLESQRLAETDGLVATICSARDFLREAIILHALNWIRDITSFDGNSPFRESAKNLLAQVLLEPGFKLSKPISVDLFGGQSQDVNRACMTQGIPLDGRFFNMVLRNDFDLGLENLSSSTTSIPVETLASQHVESRIIYLLAFEVRFVSAVRKRLTRSILPVLFIDSLVKSRFCEQYLHAYSMLTQILASSDREEELASSTEISIQLFTCPQTNKWIFSSKNFSTMLYPLCKLIETKSAAPNSEGIPNLKDVVHDIQSKRDLSSVQHTVKICLENITRVVTKNDEENLLNYVLEPQTLSLFLSFLRFFQGLSPVIRKIGDHVERESMTELYSFISKAVPVSSIVFHSTRVSNLNHDAAKRAIKTIFFYLKSRGEHISKNSGSTFKVSDSAVSPFNPINYFLSFLIQVTGVSAIQDFLCDPKNQFFLISDYSTRSIVLVSQVKLGLWIRNGISVSRQVKYLLESSADITYSRDMHLNQVAALVDEPLKFFLGLLTRWELSDWFTGQVSHSETVYEQRFSFICELFLSFLYKMLVDRSQFDKEDASAPNIEKIKMAICYALCDEPKSYSRLKKSLPLYISKSENFDRLLNACADYQAPVGFYDVGLYRLKALLFKDLDPMGQIDENTLISSFEALYSRHKDHGSPDGILHPRILLSKSKFVNTNLGTVFRTKTFAKFVYKLLQVAITTEDEGYLPHLLHLLHAIVLDGEQNFGGDFIEPNLVAIPISNLLLTITESNMTSHIVLKAKHMLDIFISRDAGVVDSLRDCFGEAHIESYHTRSNSSPNSKRQKQSLSASSRKAKLLKKFAKQRKKFMEKNEHVADQLSDSSSSFRSSPLRNCVYCGESESVEKPFGIPNTTISAPIFWKLSPNNTDFVYHAFSDYSAPYPMREDEIYSKGYPRDLMSKSEVSSSCSHGTHVHCHERARFSKSFPCPCPLCHNLFDEIIPSYIHDQHFILPSLLEGEPSSPNKVVVSFDSERNRNKELLQSVIHAGYFGDSKTLHENIRNHLSNSLSLFAPNGGSSTEKSLAALQKLESLIATTIQAHEMAMRIDLSSTSSLHMGKISPSLCALIRSLIQSRVLLFESHSQENSNTSDPLECDSGTDTIFREIVSLFFKTSESFETLVRYGYAKMVAFTSITLCVDFEGFLSNSRFMPEPTLPAKFSKNSVAYYQQAISGLKFELSSKSQCYFEKFYLALERCLFPFLRQCAILKQILFNYQDTEIDIKLDPGFNTQGDSAERQCRPFSADPLCQYLNLPNLWEIMSSSKSEKSLEFELSIIKTWSAHTFSKSLPAKSGLLDYPNVPRLINLPTDFSHAIADPEHISPSESICLLCGERVSSWRRPNHQKKCSTMTIFLCPDENSLISIVELGRSPFEIEIAGPYMTSHGEVKRSSSHEKATLSRLRYAHLNKLWINQELFGLITRSMYGERMNPLGAVTEEAGEIPDDESFDDPEIWA